ncbi:WRKY DNA-binding transcription factor 70-like [Macadamia integrifolia]|uniref:WRKY DNA-binding transcription factor 70-like n=1 Tax=Macadamia integrifolia TaxID=60698 RepID=UPI001C501A95|nr:WRKY DNA-binding transcription factor 70-like [Macadamia integrifolia]
MESTHNHTVQEKMMEELVRGREFATQLQLVLHELTGSGHDSAMAKDLVTKILRSFTEALAILSYTKSGEVPASSPCQDQCRKGSKRRNMQETWTRITSMPIQDGYAWRKYGQKEIFNAKHLRCYFRCTHKLDQGCEATKQVQRTEDTPPKFWTKYIGHHTCQDHVLNQASCILDSTTAEEGVLLNFESNTTTKQEPLLFLSFFPSSKEEHKKPFPSIEQEYNLPSSEYLPPQDDLTKFKSTMPSSVLPSTSKLDHADVIVSEGSNSFDDIDMELIDSFYLNDLFFDEELF